MGAIYLPGRGVVDLAGVSVDRAVNQYDERLSFGRNEETGDYCIFVKMPRGWDGPEHGLPILGFQREVPTVDEAMKRLWQSDTLRHGERILNEVNRENDRIQRELDYRASEGAGELAEVVESYVVHNTDATKHGRSLSKSVESRRSGGKI